MKYTAALGLIGAAIAAPEADLVKKLPDYPATDFKVYSGYLTVPAYEGGDYDKLEIHYQFHEAQKSPATAPVATWHQGGPGGSSMYGLYGEMGYFQTEDNEEGGVRHRVNGFAWNTVANMLYLESPAGSGQSAGFSKCYKNGQVQSRCVWSDRTQAAAYAHTLKAFFKAFPEYANNDLYLTGESYAGQYLPNIASYILNNTNVVGNLKGLAIGNGCWGGSENSVACNGPNEDQNDIDMFFGKGLISKAMYEEVQAACDWPNFSLKCEAAQNKAFNEVGPHNIYNIYDTCPLGNFEEWHRRADKSVRWVHKFHRESFNNGMSRKEVRAHLTNLGGGFDYGCGQDEDNEIYLGRADVQAALHLGKPGVSGFGYRQSGPASQLLYPELVKKLRILIFNGDADACVPYKGNEEWTTKLAADKHVKQTKKWHPWYATDSHRSAGHAPAGYATSYVSPTGLDFNFVTIRLSGHMVPAFTPDAALHMFKRFLNNEQW